MYASTHIEGEKDTALQGALSLLLMLTNNYSKEYIWSENYFDRFCEETARITAQEHNIDQQELSVMIEDGMSHIYL